MHFSLKRERIKIGKTTDKEEDVLSNYIELDSYLMQVIYHAKETESGS